MKNVASNGIRFINAEKGGKALEKSLERAATYSKDKAVYKEEKMVEWLKRKQENYLNYMKNKER